MIFNISGRTDIVNYYHKWLSNRLEEGYVYSRNPYNKRQVTKYNLDENSIDYLVFCSKNYKPFLNDISNIDDKYPLICHYTITTYSNDVEGNVPSIDESIDTLIELSEIIGKEKIVWRFDPILFTGKYQKEEHLKAYEHILNSISHNISFCIFSFVDLYKKLNKNMPELIPMSAEDKCDIIKCLGLISRKYNTPIHSCLINKNLSNYGIVNSGCITRGILENASNVRFKNIKHQGMRKGCKCLKWHDFGMYNTCINGCKYCYANKNKHAAKQNYKLHDDASPLLIGKLGDNDVITEKKSNSLLIDSKQTFLF